nr:hypothetical protein [Candidatus Sigynarchaeum springense]
MNETKKNAAMALIEKAEQRMRENVDDEIEAAKAGAFHTGIDIRKYEAAKAMFEEALQLEPGNQQALAGIADCNELLRGYVPVQCMVPVGSVMDIEGLLRVEGVSPSRREAPEPEKMPWELLREKRRRDRERLAYTGAMFGKAVEEADAQVEKIVAKAVAMAKKDPRNARAIHDAAVAEIGTFQERLDRGWKGHGPAVRDVALARLDAAFKAIDR